MKLKLRSEKDLLRYVLALNIDEGIRIPIKEGMIIITRYDSRFYLKMEGKNELEKIFNDDNELLNFIRPYISFPNEAELY
ncbi:MAG TPA: hypothetical protein VKU94_00355 [Geobacterales bacterium]|nr:hypothetical protein [Geobacterales bacterium]